MTVIQARARVASRLANAFILERVKLGGYGRNVIDFLIRSAVGEANQSYLSRDPQLNRRFAGLDQDPPDEFRRPVSINALANSLQAPFETVRRRVNANCELGALRIVPGGVIIPQAGTSSPGARSALMTRWGRLQRFYDRLRGIGLLEDLDRSQPAFDPATPPVRLAARHVTEYMLRFTEPRILRLRDPVRALVLMEMINANTEHIDDHEFGLEGLAPPDGWRRPIPARALSRRLGCAYETVRRHIAAIEQLGLCRREGRGYIVPTEVLSAPHIQQFADDQLVQLTRLFSILAEHGVVTAWEAERNPARSDRARRGGQA